jgi:hypothetical protein
MRCGCPVEIGGFRWNPEETDSYKIDYSSVGAWDRAVFEKWRDLKAGIGSGLHAHPESKSGRKPPTGVVLAACRAYGSLLFAHTFERRAISFLIHKSSVGTALRPAVVLWVVNLGAVADGSVPMPITLGWVGRHGRCLLSSVVERFEPKFVVALISPNR